MQKRKTEKIGRMEMHSLRVQQGISAQYAYCGTPLHPFEKNVMVAGKSFHAFLKKSTNFEN